MAGYSRQRAAEIVVGAVARASDIAAELDQVQSAFSASTGHTHSGVSGEGSPITVLGPAQDIVISGTVLRPKTDNTVDLGTSTLEFKDGYFDGKVYADAINLNGTDITATAAEINTVAAKANSTVTITAGNGLTGGGDLSANRTLTVGTPSSLTATSTNAVTSTSHTHAIDSTIARSARTITAGDGLTGGGDLSADRFFSVVAGDGISVGPSSVAVDSTVVRTTGTQSIGGVKGFDDQIFLNDVAVFASTIQQGNADGVTLGNRGLISTIGANNSLLTLQCLAATGNDELMFRVVRGATARMRVLADGDVENTNNSYGGISDERLKQDIIDAGPQLEELRDLEVKKYRFKDEPEAPLQIGLIAQDVLDVKPGLVQEGSDGYMSIRYSVLVPILVKAIQELADKVDALEQRVEDLENEV
jgi:hypothetical protein